MRQKLKIALQMDPLERLDLKGDTTFILGHEALKRGFEVYFYSASDLTYKNGFVYANTKILDLAFKNGNEKFCFRSHPRPSQTQATKLNQSGSRGIAALAGCQ